MGWETRVLGSVGRRRKFHLVLKLGKMMPAAVGSSIAAILVLASANAGWMYRQAAIPAAHPAIASSRSAIVQQSAPLLKARQTSAIVAGHPSLQPFLYGPRHTRLTVD